MAKEGVVDPGYVGGVGGGAEYKINFLRFLVQVFPTAIPPLPLIPTVTYMAFQTAKIIQYKQHNNQLLWEMCNRWLPKCVCY